MDGYNDIDHVVLSVLVDGVGLTSGPSKVSPIKTTNGDMIRKLSNKELCTLYYLMEVFGHYSEGRKLDISIPKELQEWLDKEPDALDEYLFSKCKEEEE